DLSLVILFNDTPNTKIYTLSLHDALPISYDVNKREKNSELPFDPPVPRIYWPTAPKQHRKQPGTKHRLNVGRIQHDAERGTKGRSEEHTSELQSPCNLVCRLLLEKKKKKK